MWCDRLHEAGVGTVDAVRTNNMPWSVSKRKNIRSAAQYAFHVADWKVTKLETMLGCGDLETCAPLPIVLSRIRRVVWQLALRQGQT